MDFSVLLWFFLFVVAAVVAIKLAIKISKIVVSIVSVVIIALLFFGFLAYNGVIDIDKIGLKEHTTSILSQGKEKVTGYVVENGKKILGFEKKEETKQEES